MLKSLTSPWETITIRIKEQEKYQSWQKSDCIGIFLTIYLPNYLQSKQHTYQTHYWQTKTAYLQKYFLLTHLTKGGLAEQIIKLDSLHNFCICFSFSSPLYLSERMLRTCTVSPLWLWPWMRKRRVCVGRTAGWGRISGWWKRDAGTRPT